MVIGFVVQYGKAPVDLLQEKYPDHLVGEGHPGKGERPCRPSAECFGKTLGAPHGEDQLSGATVPLGAEESGQLG